MLSNSIYQEDKIPTQFERFWRSYRTNSFSMFGLWCLSLLVFITLLAPWIAPHGAQVQTGNLLLPPSWDPSELWVTGVASSTMQPESTRRSLLLAKASDLPSVSRKEVRHLAVL